LNPLTEDAIALTHEVSRRGVLREGMDKLLADPSGTRVRGNIEWDHLPSVVSRNEEDEKDRGEHLRHPVNLLQTFS